MAVTVAVAVPVAVTVAGVTAVVVPADPLPAARSAGDGPVVADHHRCRSRVAGAGTGTGTAAWAGERRLASGRARHGTVSCGRWQMSIDVRMNFMVPDSCLLARRADLRSRRGAG